MIIVGVLAMLAGVALIFAVVIQNSKGGGLSSTFAGGNASQLLGARRSAEFIEKATWVLFGSMVLLAFVANVVGSGGSTSTRLRIQENVNSQFIQNSVQDVSTFEQPVEGGTEAGTEEGAPAEGN